MGLPDFTLSAQLVPSQPADRYKHRPRRSVSSSPLHLLICQQQKTLTSAVASYGRPSKYFLKKYRGLFSQDEDDDISTPARRRRIVHEVGVWACWLGEDWIESHR
jgi:hypothetical protein